MSFVSSSGIKPLLSTVDTEINNVMGFAEIQMGIYETDEFKNLVPVNHTFIVPDMIFAKIELKDDAEWITPTLKNCWATPTLVFLGKILFNYFFRSNPFDTTKYSFIENFCSLEDDTILMIDGPHFALQSFMFVGDRPQIFLHCQVIKIKKPFMLIVIFTDIYILIDSNRFD